MLAASAAAGLLWSRFGPASTFHAGAVFCVIALDGAVWKPITRPFFILKGAAKHDPAPGTPERRRPRSAGAADRGTDGLGSVEEQLP